ncbi:hypothetical protein BOX15_Mlig029574g1 [Macrostomum lignano]|uniref:Ig-like domain-containing protein n=1 Tax=Macrostomum lignano TaxID=282301 RepID=A0A267FAZ5_9PLAT|nr:hypothetical protein BOX15_Mlig029574g1 [Macrostomum lignano]
MSAETTWLCSRQSLPLLLLLSLAVSSCLGASLSPTGSGAVSEPADVLEGDWIKFDCPYDQGLDKSKLHELGASVQDCQQPLELLQDPGLFTRALVAAVLGKVSALSDSMNSGVLKGRQPPALQVNSQHPLVRDGLVEVDEARSSVGLIRLRVRAVTNRTGGLCAVCGQTVSSFGYSMVKKTALGIRKPPVASLSFVSQRSPAAALYSETRDAAGARRLELQSGALPGWLRCDGAAEQLTAVRLFKDDKLLNETPDSRLQQSLGPDFSEQLIGSYRCEAVSSQPFLMEKGKNIGFDSLYLLGPFKPRFELSELVRYTPVGQQEDVQVKVFGYPQPSPVSCSFDSDGYPAPPEPELRQAYSQGDFSATYLIRLSNSLPGNQTRLTCHSENELGRAELRILLTALAPQPEIVSDGDTRFYNSYQLRWQHDAKAYVDFYRVQIVFRTGDDSNFTTAHEEFAASASAAQPPNGATAALVGARLTDRGGGGGGIVSGGRGSADSSEKRQSSRTLYSLRPDTEHEIRLSSCNRHGCSEFSEPVRVRTPKKSDQTYNDPANPVKAFVDPGNSAGTTGVSAVLLSLTTLSLLTAAAFC